MKMKISQYAKLHGVTTRTVWNWIYKGEVNIERTKTNRVLIVFNENEELSTAIYCRVSSSENKNNLESQKNRLISYCNAKGYKVNRIVTRFFAKHLLCEVVGC